MAASQPDAKGNVHAVWQADLTFSGVANSGSQKVKLNQHLPTCGAGVREEEEEESCAA